MRTFKRSFFATVAVAALFLSATSVRGAIVNLAIDPTQSSLSISGSVAGGPFGAAKAYLQQGAGSLTTTYSGAVDIDLALGTIQLLPTSQIIAANSGNWRPAPGPGPGNPDPVGGYNSAGTTPANYGVQIPSGATQSSFTGLVFSFGVPPQPAIPGGVPSTPMPLIGNNFNLTGQGMSFIAGRRLIVFANGPPLGVNDNSGVAGFPTLFGTNGADIGSWDGTTLIIPVHSTLTYVIDEALGISDTIQFTGQIVATLVPEPSSVIMAGLGVVGLVAAGYRARKRKA